MGWCVNQLGVAHSPEKLDQAIFLALSLFGAFLVLSQFFLSWVCKHKERVLCVSALELNCSRFDLLGRTNL